MKKILTMALAILSLSACDDEESKFKGNDTPIYIYGRDNMNKAETLQEKLSVHEILEWAKDDEHDLVLQGNVDDDGVFGKHFMQSGTLSNVDLDNDRLIMDGANIIEDEHIYQWGGWFVSGRNFYLYKFNSIAGEVGDTVGYIPNSVIREAQKDILDMWKAGDISAIYERFQQAFYFTPCTAEEFKAIKEDIDWEHEYDDLKAEHEHTHEIRW